MFHILTLEYDEKIAREVELEEAREEGIEMGIAQGMELGKLQGAIKVLKNLNVPSELILQQLKQQFSLTEEKAKEYLLKY